MLAAAARPRHDPETPIFEPYYPQVGPSRSWVARAPGGDGGYPRGLT